MCDFHSICVRRDGAIAHVPGNSHSEAIEKAGWRENDRMADFRGPFFVEVEWNGEGAFPGIERITRNSRDLSEAQRKTIEFHYKALADLLSDPKNNAEKMLLGTGCFSGDEYADIRWRVLIDPRCPKRVADKLAKTKLHANGETIKSIRPDIVSMEGSIRIAENATLTAPALTKSGYIYVRQGATLTAPALTKSGSIDVRQGATLTAPALTKSGSIDVRQGATLTAPALTEVSGYIYVRQGATLTAPALTEVSGSIDVQEGATLTAPNLKRNN